MSNSTASLDAAYAALRQSLSPEQWRLFLTVEELWYQEQNFLPEAYDMTNED